MPDTRPDTAALHNELERLADIPRHEAVLQRSGEPTVENLPGDPRRIGHRSRLRASSNGLPLSLIHI